MTGDGTVGGRAIRFGYVAERLFQAESSLSISVKSTEKKANYIQQCVENLRY